MTLRISGKSISVGDALRGRVSARTEEVLRKYFDGNYSGHITLSKDGLGFRTDCSLHLDSGITLEADSNAQDAYASDPSNIAFLLNAVDWLALDEGLIQIRTREVTNRPLAEVSEGVKTTVKYANILGPASLVILFGVVRWQLRRRRKSTEL